jgi:hypothetical protein
MFQASRRIVGRAFFGQSVTKGRVVMTGVSAAATY